MPVFDKIIKYVVSLEMGMSGTLPESKNMIEVRSALGKIIRTTEEYYRRICTVKHPELHEPIEEVLKTFTHPTEIRFAEQDIFLYYRRLNQHALVAVARHLNGDGFLVTAYKTTKKKRKGKFVWPKRK